MTYQVFSVSTEWGLRYQICEVDKRGRLTGESYGGGMTYGNRAEAEADAAKINANPLTETLPLPQLLGNGD